MKNNNRRKGRERLKKQDWAEPEKTTYNVRTVTKEERKGLVANITQKSKRLERIAIWVAVFVSLMFTVWLIW